MREPLTDRFDPKSQSAVIQRPQTGQFKDLAELDAKIPRNMMMEYQGKPFILKAGLELKASQVFGVGNYSLTTEIIERTDNRVVVRAVLTTPQGKTFNNFGEVNRYNTNKLMFNNALHLAVTRAECRVLRMATACGYVAYEEVEGQETVKEIPATDTDGQPATEAQLGVIKTLSGIITENMTQGEAKLEIARLSVNKS